MSICDLSYYELFFCSTMRKKQQRFFVSPIVDGTLPKVSDVECRYSNPDNIKKEPSNGEATYENMD